jgi:hypothetical protein
MRYKGQTEYGWDIEQLRAGKYASPKSKLQWLGSALNFAVKTMEMRKKQGKPYIIP